MIRKIDPIRHGKLYCPFCGTPVADCFESIHEDGGRIKESDIIECDNCGYEAYATLFPFKPSKIMIRSGEPRNNIGLHESMRETPVEQHRRIWSC